MLVVIAEALQLALKRVSSLIVSLSEGGKALPIRDLALLNNLVDALRSYPYTRHAATLNKYVLPHSVLQPAIQDHKLLLGHANFSNKVAN